MDGTAEHLARIAAGRRDAFAGRNAVSRSGTVHAVADVDILGQTWPGTACHTGVYGGEMSGLEPTLDPVTCRSCHRALGLTDAPEHPTLF